MLRHICSRVHSEWFYLGSVHLNCLNSSFILDLETYCAFSKKKKIVYIHVYVLCKIITLNARGTYLSRSGDRVHKF